MKILGRVHIDGFGKVDVFENNDGRRFFAVDQVAEALGLPAEQQGAEKTLGQHSGFRCLDVRVFDHA